MFPQIDAALLAAKYGSKALAALVLTVSLVAGYYYWKHEVASEAKDKAVSECNDSRVKFRIEAEHFKLSKQEEIDKISKEQDERLENAIKIYVKHYELNRNTPIANSLRVKADCTVSAGSNAVPGAGQNRPAAKEGSERSGEAELSAGNLRQLNEVISKIEEMELKCERVLNTIPE